jgi:hypothetical protein
MNEAIATKALENLRARVAELETDRDAARAEVERLRAELAKRCSCDGDPIECSHEAARGQAEAAVQRAREVAAYFRDREADLKKRYDREQDDARSTALLSSAALTGDAAHRIERALGGTEAGW